MTPKKKAKELVENYIIIYNQNDWFYINLAKKAALIAVDEMVEEISKWAGGNFIEWEKERWKYLHEVKQEIEKL